MKKISIILVHGIGNQTEDWAKDLIQKLRDNVVARLKILVPEDLPSNVDDVMVMEAVYWADLFQERQKKLEAVLDRDTDPVVLSGSPWDKVLKGVSFVLERVFKKFQNWIICEFIGDIIGYPGAQKIIKGKIDGALDNLGKQITGTLDKVPVTFIAHSLGTVIASDYIYDARKGRGDGNGFHDRLELENIFTIGSPIALFSIRYGGPEAFQPPISVERETGRWINIYDKDDPVGMPLKSLNEAYGAVVFKDVRVEAGIYGECHTKYFEKSETLKTISSKLALDWIALNGKLPKEDIKRLYWEYDRTLGQGRVMHSLGSQVAESVAEQA